MSDIVLYHKNILNHGLVFGNGQYEDASWPMARLYDGDIKKPYRTLAEGAHNLIILQQADGPNLLPNWNFATHTGDDFGDWTEVESAGDGTAEITADTTNVYVYGTAQAVACKIALTGTTSYGYVMSPFIPVNPGTAYYLAAITKKLSGTCSVYLQVSCYDMDQNAIASGINVVAGQAPAADWHIYGGALNPAGGDSPAMSRGTAYIRVLAYNYQAAGNLAIGGVILAPYRACTNVDTLIIPASHRLSGADMVLYSGANLDSLAARSTWTQDDNGQIKRSFTGQDDEVWWLAFANVENKVQMAEIFLGQGYTFETQPWFPQEYGDRDNVTLTTAPGGRSARDVRGPDRRARRYVLNAIGDAQVANLVLFDRECGRAKGFWISDHAGELYLAALEEKPLFRKVRAGQTDVALAILEEI